MPQAPNPGSGSTGPVGTGERKVRQGECVISIASEVGHFWETIWNDPDNAELQQKRGAPHVLLAGDRLHIPPIRPQSTSAQSDQRHRFRRKGIPVAFEIVLTENDEPLSGCSYVLVLEGAEAGEGTVGNDGVIRVPMAPGTREGELRVQVDSVERVYPLLFGELDPPQTTSGALGRLQNLGYTAADDEDAFSLGLKRFQKDHQLTDSGELDDATAAKLVEIHGS